MQYRLDLSNATIKRRAGQSLKNNQIKFGLAVLLNAVIILGITSGIMGLLKVKIVLPEQSLDQFYVQTPSFLRTLFVTFKNQWAAQDLMIMGGAIFVLTFLCAQLQVFGLTWGSLNMADSGKFSWKSVWSPFTHRPIRHYFLSLLSGIIQYMATFIFVGTFVCLLAFYSVVIVSTGRAAIGQWTYYLIHALYLTIMVLVMILVGLFSGWLYYGFSLMTYPCYDNRKTGFFRALRMSWSLMSGNRVRLFKWRIWYRLLPAALVTGVLAGIIGAKDIFMTKGTSSLGEIGIWTGTGAIAFLYILFNWLKSYAVEAVFYRELTYQYAFALNEKYPGFGAAPAKDLSTFYHTEERPQFTADTVAVDAGMLLGQTADLKVEEDTLSEEAFKEHFGPAESEKESETLKIKKPQEIPPLYDWNVTEGEETKTSLTPPPETGKKLAEDDHPILVMSDVGEEEKISYVPVKDPDEIEPIEEPKKILEKEEEYDFVDPGYVLDKSQQTPVQPAAAVFAPSEEQEIEKAEQPLQPEHVEPISNIQDKRDVQVNQLKSEEKITMEKQPYNPYGYNTPKRTNFKKTEHTEEIILGADKAQADNYKNSLIRPGDFEKEDDKK